MRPLLVLMLLTGCSDDVVLEPGVLHLDNYSPRISMPTTGTAGSPIEVSVTTYGGNCRAMGPTDVTVSGDEALVEPYARRSTDGACIKLVLFYDHKTTITTITFPTPGLKTVRFLGRHVSSYAPIVDEPLEVSMSITIQ